MTAAPGRGRVAATVALVATFLVLVAPALAWAGEPRKPAAPATSPAAAPSQDVEDLLYADPVTLVALAALKFVPAIVGVVLLSLELGRRAEDRAAGRRVLVPHAPPPVPFSALSAFSLLVGAFLVPGIVLGGIAKASGLTSLPFWAHVAATAAGTLPVAGLVLWRRMRLKDAAPASTTALEGVFAEDAGLSPAAPAPASAPPRGALADALRTFCVSAAAVLVAGLATRVLLQTLTPIRPDSQNLVKDVVSGPFDDALVIAVYGILIAPFVEECLFRGMLYPSLRRAGAGTAAVVSSAVFAGIHVNKPADLYSVGSLFVLAWLLARLYERRASLFATTVVHALNNATTLVPLLLLRS